MNHQQTLFEKIWNAHVVAQEKNSPAVLYIDLHLVHEVTSPQAFAGLKERGLKVRRTDRTIATMDHSIPTDPPHLPIADELAAQQLKLLEKNTKEFGIRLYDMNSTHRGIVHVIGPELGYTQPGMTIVCGDSHTATHGAFGALAFGIGTSEVEHVLATQCLLQKRPKTCRVRIDGKLGKAITGKDIILALLAKYGTAAGSEHVFEYTGNAVTTLSMEQRMTVCNMSIEGGARAGMIAPDDTTFQYLSGKQFVPQDAKFDEAVKQWRLLATDEGAIYDKELSLDVDSLEPMITYGTNPGMGIPITGTIPDPASLTDLSQRAASEKALAYMGLKPGRKLLGQKVDVVFIGSCTNSRIEDLRHAASVMRDRKVAPNVRTLIVPGSQAIKEQAEAEGLADIFKSAGAEWREAGCSMCIAMNPDQVPVGQYAVSTSNRNFEGRQGKGSRSFLASPYTAAAAAVTGVVTDVRTMIR
jgi:3-isopropylmalate/(R)-2-methylmalate dehydratase large subunit